MFGCVSKIQVKSSQDSWDFDEGFAGNVDLFFGQIGLLPFHTNIN
jgi:hypothetical protein